MSAGSGTPCHGTALRLAAVTVAALVALSGCATGEPDELDPGLPGAEGPTTDLVITLDETGEGTEVRTLTLTCEPEGGTHPDPEAACEAIAEAGGAVAFSTPTDDMTCTEQYGGPQVATVEGKVDGEPVRTTYTRTNGCQISRWDGLAVVLDSIGGAA
ncbi:MAG: hypothetical protein JWP95_1895 [Actinotalea sp.]|nr:hypothetical protein [Actinotalea sp.]